MLEALENYDFSGISHLCDIGGGHGLTLCSLLVKYPHLRGTVLELPSVVENKELLWADKLGVGHRCAYIAGDMFREVPPADAYMVKRVLHDWNDGECINPTKASRQRQRASARASIPLFAAPDARHSAAAVVSRPEDKRQAAVSRETL